MRRDVRGQSVLDFHRQPAAEANPAWSWWGQQRGSNFNLFLLPTHPPQTHPPNCAVTDAIQHSVQVQELDQLMDGHCEGRFEGEGDAEVRVQRGGDESPHSRLVASGWTNLLSKGTTFQSQGRKDLQLLSRPTEDKDGAAVMPFGFEVWGDNSPPFSTSPFISVSSDSDVNGTVDVYRTGGVKKVAEARSRDRQWFAICLQCFTSPKCQRSHGIVSKWDSRA